MTMIHAVISKIKMWTDCGVSYSSLWSRTNKTTNDIHVVQTVVVAVWQMYVWPKCLFFAIVLNVCQTEATSEQGSEGNVWWVLCMWFAWVRNSQKYMCYVTFRRLKLKGSLFFPLCFCFGVVFFHVYGLTGVDSWKNNKWKRKLVKNKIKSSAPVCQQTNQSFYV